MDEIKINLTVNISLPQEKLTVNGVLFGLTQLIKEVFFIRSPGRTGKATAQPGLPWSIRQKWSSNSRKGDPDRMGDLPLSSPVTQR